MKITRSILILLFFFSEISRSKEIKGILEKSDYKSQIASFDIYAPPKEAKSLLSRQELYKRIATKGISLKTSREGLKSALENQKSVKMTRLPSAAINGSQYYGQTQQEVALTDTLGNPYSEEQTTRTRYYGAGLSLTGEPITGVSYTLTSPSLRRDLSNDSTPTDTGGIGIDLTLKLLKGSPFYNFGKKERLASIAVRIAREDLRGATLQSITTSEQQYYDLILKYLRIQIQKRALTAAQSLRRDTAELIKVGESDKISGLKADLQVTQTENDLLAAEIELESAKQALFESMNLQNESIDSFFPDPKEVKLDPKVPELNLSELIKVANENRPDIRATRLKIEKGDIEAKIAKTNAYPSLDAKIGRSNSGVNDSPGGALGDTQRGEKKDFTAQLTLSYIFFNNADDLAAKTSAIELMKTKLSLDELRQKVVKEISSAVSKVQIGTRKLKASSQSREISETQLTAEYEKYAAGESTLKSVIETQQQVISARLSEIQARVDLLSALTQLRTAKGELPEGLSYQGD